MRCLSRRAWLLRSNSFPTKRMTNFRPALDEADILMQINLIISKSWRQAGFGQSVLAEGDGFDNVLGLAAKAC